MWVVKKGLSLRDCQRLDKTHTKSVWNERQLAYVNWVCIHGFMPEAIGLDELGYTLAYKHFGYDPFVPP
ncbi:hypothetical protein KUL118_16850 [Tenacibaculum sp. KUL118]|nr:hypothetical protein KUL118_16850 [Tenacibaculum sp. KUL118]